MAFVHSFENFRPPVRTDEPWTGIVPHQAGDAEGTGDIELDVIALDPLDDDPTSPVLRDFTVEDATLAEGFFRFYFIDANDNLSPPTSWVQSPATDADETTRARAHVERMTASDYPPELSEDDIEALLYLARREDVDGNEPDDSDWVPTYDINYAICCGWETKAARAAGNFRFEEDQQAFYREQVFRHCRAMADRYNRGMTPVVVTAYGATV